MFDIVICFVCRIKPAQMVLSIEEMRSKPVRAYGHLRTWGEGRGGGGGLVAVAILPEKILPNARNTFKSQ